MDLPYPGPAAATRPLGLVALAGPERMRRVAVLGGGFALVAGVSALGREVTQAGVGRGALAAALVLAPLLFGRWLLARRRPLAAPLLLFGVPVGAALGGLFARAVTVDPVVASVLILVAIGYLVESSRLLTQADEPALASARSEPRQSPAPPRVLRRLRLFRALTVAAALAFAWPVSCALFDGGGPSVLVVAAVALLGTLVCRAFLVDALERHLQRDPALQAALTRLRGQARHGRPTRAFYLAASVALVAMALLVVRRGLGFGP